jgi:hypothetical protein
MTDPSQPEPEVDSAELDEILRNAAEVIRGENGLETRVAALLEQPFSEDRAKQVSAYLSSEQMRRARTAASDLAAVEAKRS